MRISRAANELDESLDLYKCPAWFMDNVHTVPRWPIHPLDHVWPRAEQGLCWACQKVSHPQIKGWMWKTREGSAYMAPLVINDPEERKAREPAFRQALVPFIEDFRKVWDESKKKFDDYYAPLDSVDPSKLSDIELEEHYRRLCEIEVEVWKEHFYLMEGVGSLTMLFEDTARELCKIDSSQPIWSDVVSGFESKAFTSDYEMWKLSELAKELGLESIFLNNRGKKLYSQIKKAAEGKTFLKKLGDFLKSDYGLRTVQLLNFATPTWRERPDIVLDNIKIYVEKGAAFKIFDEREKAATKRKQAEKELLSKVPSDQRDWFTKLMQMAQNWGWWSEEHEFWLNDHIYSLIHFTMVEYGKRFVQAGAFDDVEDIWHITEADFENTLHFPENYNLRPQVAKNRAELETYEKINSVPIVTYKGMDEALKWLISIREFHVALSMGYMPEPKEGVNASLWGTCGRPGTVEGPARVVKRDQDLLDVQPGDILVAPTTYVTWTPIFSKIAGLVVDRGGSLSHSAICAREYGIPCVLNTFEGTQMIKSGMHIRLEADIGAVFILDG